MVVFVLFRGLDDTKILTLVSSPLIEAFQWDFLVHITILIALMESPKFPCSSSSRGALLKQGWIIIGLSGLANQFN